MFSASLEIISLIISFCWEVTIGFSAWALWGANDFSTGFDEAIETSFQADCYFSATTSFFGGSSSGTFESSYFLPCIKP